MRLRKPCEHDLYDEHGIWVTNNRYESCPGGEFLPEDALVIERADLPRQFPDWFPPVVDPENPTPEELTALDAAWEERMGPVVAWKNSVGHLGAYAAAFVDMVDLSIACGKGEAIYIKKEDGKWPDALVVGWCEVCEDLWDSGHWTGEEWERRGHSGINACRQGQRLLVRLAPDQVGEPG